MGPALVVYLCFVRDDGGSRLGRTIGLAGACDSHVV